MNDDIVRSIELAVKKAFSMEVEGKRYIDVSRIPLICQNINVIHEDIKEIKDTLQERVVTQDQFWPVRTLVYGFVAVMLMAVVGGILALVGLHK